MEEISTKRVSDVVDLERDILPYRLIQLVAGVGAGKNYWVDQISREKKEGGKSYNTLLITSRAMTANTQAGKMKADRWIDLKEISRESFGKVPPTKVVVTNSGIEHFLKKQYSPDDDKTHIWNYFDFIILDEAHSLATDATFADAPFYVHQFLRHALHKNKNCHIIIMTGTPEPIEWLFSEELKNHLKYNHLNIFDKCNHVEPENVILESKTEVVSIIKDALEQKYRIIYFARTIERISELYDLLVRTGIDKQSIGIDYADENKDKDFSSEILQRREKIQQELRDIERLPDDIKIFITTGKNKEGININNEDIKIMFAESCQRAEIIQMAGRVRAGLEYLFVIYDTDNMNNFGKISFEITRDISCLEDVNLALEDYEKETDRLMWHGDPLNFEHRLKKNGIIQNIEETFPNIRYDLFTQEFMEYKGRIQGNTQMIIDTYSLKEYIEYWIDPVYLNPNTSDDDSFEDIFKEVNETGKDQFTSWFPYSSIDLWGSVINPLVGIHEAIKELLVKRDYLDKKIAKEQRDSLISEIKKILPEYDCKKANINLDFQNLGPILKKVGFTIESVGSHKKDQGKFIIHILEGWGKN